jgi:hypothetical protein
LEVAFGGSQAFVAEEDLDFADVDAAFHEVGGEAVAEEMAGDGLADARPLPGMSQGAADRLPSEWYFLVSLAARKYQLVEVLSVDVCLEFVGQGRWAEGHARLAAFALAYAHHHFVEIQVGNQEPLGLGTAETDAIECAGEETVLGLTDR